MLWLSNVLTMRVPDDDCFRSPSVLTELDIYVFIHEAFMFDLYHIDNKHIDLSDHEMFVAMRSIFFFRWTNGGKKYFPPLSYSIFL